MPILRRIYYSDSSRLLVLEWSWNLALLTGVRPLRQIWQTMNLLNGLQYVWKA